MKALKALEESPHPSAQHVRKNYHRMYNVLGVEGEIDLAELAAGPIRFAYIGDERIAPLQERRTVGFRLQDTPKIVLVVGQPGTGKTTLFCTIICELLKQ